MLNIRKANPEDTCVILDFIKELAEYEKLSHECIASEELIKIALFSNIPKAYAIISEWEGNPVGFALYFYNFSTFLSRSGIYIEDIYVKPSHRGKGIGKKLMTYLANEAINEQCGRLEWWVLDWNKQSIDFYKSLGAESMNDWTTYRLSGSNLEKLANYCNKAII